MPQTLSSVTTNIKASGIVLTEQPTTERFVIFYIKRKQVLSGCCPGGANSNGRNPERMEARANLHRKNASS